MSVMRAAEKQTNSDRFVRGCTVSTARRFFGAQKALEGRHDKQCACVPLQKQHGSNGKINERVLKRVQQATDE